MDSNASSKTAIRPDPPSDELKPHIDRLHAHGLIDMHFVPDLTNHSHTRNLTRRLLERGFSDADIEKILFRNWMRVFQELL